MATVSGISPVGVQIVAKAPRASSKIPASPTVKMDKDQFADVWWICRVEGKSPAELLLELAGTQTAARRKRHEAVIAKLVKLDEAEDQTVAQARAGE